MAAFSNASGDSVCHAERIDGWEVAVVVDAGRLRASVRLVSPARPGEREITPADVRRVVEKTGIAWTEDVERQISPALAGTPPGSTLTLPLAEGVPSRAARDGSVEWLVRREARPALEDSGRVDHYQRSAIVQVRKGERILTLVPPIEGTPGRDVFGRPIPVPAPARPTVRPGDHVVLTPDALGFVAAADGRLVVRGDVVAVERSLNIPGDVDFAVGNIDFAGDVIVGKNVIDNFSVRCGSDLTVRGSVGAATLEAGGELTVLGGIAGHGSGGVTARGTVRAKYFNGARVEAGGDVVATAEIINSSVRSLGKVVAGGIVGGEVMARGGVDAGLLGSPMQVATPVIVGVDFSVESGLRRLREEAEQLNREITALSAHLSAYLEDPKRIEKLPAHRREQLRIDLLKFKEMKGRKAGVDRDLDRLAQTTAAGEKAVVVVRRTLHAGVSVRIGDSRRIFVEDIPGPLRLTANPVDQGIRVDGLRPDELPRGA